MKVAATAQDDENATIELKSSEKKEETNRRGRVISILLFFVSSLAPNSIGPEIHHLLLTAGFVFMGV
jgi:hypothetical protein